MQRPESGVRRQGLDPLEACLDRPIDRIHRALGELRRARHPFFLILKTVVETQNCRDLPKLVRFLLALSPDDMKLITSVDQKDELGSFAGATETIEELERILDEYPPDLFPLLRRQLHTVFTTDSIGLETAKPAASKSNGEHSTVRTAPSAGSSPATRTTNASLDASRRCGSSLSVCRWTAAAPAAPASCCTPSTCPTRMTCGHKRTGWITSAVSGRLDHMVV